VRVHQPSTRQQETDLERCPPAFIGGVQRRLTTESHETNSEGRHHEDHAACVHGTGGQPGPSILKTAERPLDAGPGVVRERVMPGLRLRPRLAEAVVQHGGAPLNCGQFDDVGESRQVQEHLGDPQHQHGHQNEGGGGAPAAAKRKIRQEREREELEPRRVPQQGARDDLTPRHQRIQRGRRQEEHDDLELALAVRLQQRQEQARAREYRGKAACRREAEQPETPPHQHRRERDEAGVDEQQQRRERLIGIEDHERQDREVLRRAIEIFSSLIPVCVSQVWTVPEVGVEGLCVRTGKRGVEVAPIVLEAAIDRDGEPTNAKQE
jgi:hypothetical protein